MADKMFEVDFANPNFCIGGSSEPIGRVKRGARTPIGMRVNEKRKNLKNSTKQNNYQIIKTKQQAGTDLCQAHWGIERPHKACEEGSKEPHWHEGK